MTNLNMTFNCKEFFKQGMMIRLVGRTIFVRFQTPEATITLDFDNAETARVKAEELIEAMLTA